MLSSQKIEVDRKPPLAKFPGLYKTSVGPHSIVFMHARGAGTVVWRDAVGGQPYNIGDYRNGWDMTTFKFFEGSISISQALDEDQT